MITRDFKLTLVTGLHIGASDDGMRIGGIDSPVIKREVFCNNDGKVGFEYKRKITEPYIPGSSIKGKVRSLLEHYFRLIDPMGKGLVVDRSSKFGDKKYIDLIVTLFGESAGTESKSNKITIPRVIFRDAFITEGVRKAYLENKIELFEAKHENVIDRKTGTTKKGGLRHIERVASAVEFRFNLSIRVFKDDNRKLLEDTILLGLKLLELDALGGSGSRGYGRVKFDNIDKSIKDLDESIKNELNQS